MMIYKSEIHSMRTRHGESPNKVTEYKKALRAAFLDDDVPVALSEQIYEKAYDNGNGCYSDLEGNYEELATIANSAFSYGRKHVVQKF